MPLILVITSTVSTSVLLKLIAVASGMLDILFAESLKITESTTTMIVPILVVGADTVLK